MHLRVEAENAGPDRNLVRHIESCPQQVADAGVEVLVPHRLGFEISDDVRGRDGHLRRPRRARREDRAQRLLSFHDIGQCGAQGPGVERAREPQHHRHVVRGRGGIELIDEPHPLLRPRQRRTLRAYPAAQSGGRLGTRAPRRALREPSRGAALEEVAYVEPGAECPVDPGDHARRAERVATEPEEVVVQAHPVGTGDFGEDPHHLLLRGSARRPVGRGRAAEVGFGKRVAVELADRGDGQLAENHDRVRQHVPRQSARRELREFRHVDSVVGRRHDVRREKRIAGAAAARHRHRVGHRRVGHQHRLDLAEFDPESAHLHLEVAAPQIVEGTVGPATHDVTRAVHACPGRPAGAGHESGGGQSRPPVIAAGETGTDDVQFAGHPGRDGTQVLVEHQHTGPADGRPDRDVGAGNQRCAERRDDGRLRRSVAVDHRAPRGPAGDEFRSDGVAADHEDGQIVESAGFDRRERRRRDAHVGDLLRDEEVGERGSAVHVGRRDHECGAHRTRLQQLQHREVEAR